MSTPRSKFSKPAKSRLGPVKTPGLDANKSRLGPAKTPGLDANKSRLGPVKPVGTAAKAKIKKPAFVAKPAKPNAGSVYKPGVGYVKPASRTAKKPAKKLAKKMPRRG